MTKPDPAALIEEAQRCVGSDQSRALELLRRARRHVDPQASTQLAQCWVTQAQVHWARRQFSQGLTAARRSLRLLQNAPSERAQALWIMAECQRGLGRYAGALDAWMACLEISMMSRQTELAAVACAGIGNYYQLIENTQHALNLRRQAYEFACQSKDPATIAKCAIALAGDYVRQHMSHQALPLLQVAQDLITPQMEPTWWAETLYYQGLHAFQNGNSQRAQRDLNEALTLARKADSPWVTVQCLKELARLHRNSGRYEAAVSDLQEAITIAHTFDTGYLLQSLYLVLCTSEEARGHFDAALAAHEAYHNTRMAYLKRLDEPGCRPSPNRLAQLQLRLEVIQARKENDLLQERQAAASQRAANQARLALRADLSPIERGGLEQELLRLDGQATSLLNVRLENLNEISEHYSFAIGDQVLSDLGRRLAIFARHKSCHAARYSTASFVLVVPAEQQHSVLEALVHELEELMGHMQGPAARICLRACRVHDPRTALRSVLKAPVLARLPSMNPLEQP
ncbi:tetratricopeptide (TPR) repeat protein [Silvimonas terrae]|uniref:Tetratricopeptide (TPR) repeat protein n=1 Tax=Silvimonas terrae TaxID=300266 RepID=A0A840R8T5_9NEIS|nr:diguanylate cyclase [Silvimonas terrae]MBB5189769.1 tetratricopeptide (TPR) repeat protein [Silvimonas terrae]